MIIGFAVFGFSIALIYHNYYRYGFYVLFIICDWASENGSSGHMKVHYIFQIGCIITNDPLKPLREVLSSTNNLIGYISKLTESKQELKIFTIL